MDIHPRRYTVGDRIIGSDQIAVYGIALTREREGLELEPEIISDTALLNGLVEAILTTAPDVHVLRNRRRTG